MDEKDIAEAAYKNGYAAGRAEATNPGWISVKDRLPTSGETVLTLDKFGHISDRKFRKMGAVNVFSPDGLSPGIHITHWMPIPETPKEGTR